MIKHALLVYLNWMFNPFNIIVLLDGCLMDSGKSTTVICLFCLYKKLHSNVQSQHAVG